MLLCWLVGPLLGKKKRCYCGFPSPQGVDRTGERAVRCEEFVSNKWIRLHGSGRAKGTGEGMCGKVRRGEHM